VTSSTKHIK